MYLKSIELSGFKSFAKKSSLEFNSRVSAIVGPNGSGKSNVAEAFRFVLGEQSIKSLRGKKGEDLIFNGGGGESRANRATVKVVFDNSSKAFPIDFPEVSIERAVHRDGINEYLINGSAVRLKDIVELLASANIGASGHHIISQGEADKILNSTSRDRKGIIEEALGLKIYQYKRIESERKQKKTFENIREVESLRKEIAPHLRFLKKQVEKIEKAEGQKEELLALSKEYFKREEEYITYTKSSLKKQRGPLEDKIKELRAELDKAKAILEKSALKGKQEFEVLNLETETASVRVHKDALMRELGKVEGLLGAEERIIKKQQELQTRDEHKTIRLSEVEDFAKELERDLQEGERATEINLVGDILRRIHTKISEFLTSKRDVADSSLIEEAEKEIKELTKQKTELDDKIKVAEAKENSLRNTLVDLKREIDKEKDSSHDAEKAVFRIMSEENEAISNINIIKVQEEKIKLEEDEFVRELEEVSRLIGAAVLQYKQAKSSSVEDDRPAPSWTEIREERKRSMERLKIRLEDSGVSGGEETMKEYRETTERDDFLAKELQDLGTSAESLKTLIKELEERLATEFSSGITKINREFTELFTAMFGGGHAELILTKEKKKKVEAMIEGLEIEENDESEEIIEEGLDISVVLPRKKIKGLMMLSGGERALTSIALLFAMSQVNPPPFIILDETDAALDEANSKRYGDMAEKLSMNSQLILITHNRETMSRAGTIYGVTMSSTGISKLLSIEFDEAVAVAK